MKNKALKLAVIYIVTALVVLYTVDIQSFFYEMFYEGNINPANVSAEIYHHHILIELGMAIMSSMIALIAVMLIAGIVFTALFEDSNGFIFMWGIITASIASISAPVFFSSGIPVLTSMALSAIITTVCFIAYRGAIKADNDSDITPTIIMSGSK
jgi:hypothetical protein